MLGKTAGGLYWMFRYLERSENTARLLDAGFRIALTRSTSAQDEWESVVKTAGSKPGYEAIHGRYDALRVIDFLLRDKSNPSSVLSAVEGARNNARLVRTALTREVWESTNECWMTLSTALAKEIGERDLPKVLDTIRQQSALVRGAMQGTMLRNDIYDFARLGTYLERADNTARILDVKYYVLLPSVSFVGSSLDNVQWETILRSVAGQRAYRWLYPSKIDPVTIADFLILDRRMPRSLGFCYSQIADNLGHLETDYNSRLSCHELAQETFDILKTKPIKLIFEEGLHEFIGDFIIKNTSLGTQIENDYQFVGTVK